MGANNEQVKKLCLGLMKADSEEDVISILNDAGFWEDEKNWRFYGDYENNYNTIGNQQSSPDAALVEKLVNAVDARLMNECLVRDIAPESEAAPQNIQDAVAQFFEGDANPNRATAGLVREWDTAKRTEVARGITLAATGNRSTPCFIIADCGEGQTPEMMPNTFLSTTGSNKLRVPFVQGKFNMGGTGVLKFCGEHGFQLILSRRNPGILNGKFEDESDKQWGFTIIRRTYPTGNRRSSVYSYLAPVGANDNPGKGGVLRFSSNTMPLFPEGQQPFARETEHGSLIKLYEYATKSRTHMFRKGGIQSPLDILLTDLALPIRLHECRDYEGKSGSSFETTLTGIKVRMGDDKAQNLEADFPDSTVISVAGEQMIVTIYAFKKGKAKSYRKNEGIIFTINGQTHGHLSADFFRRTKRVGLSYLKDDLLVIVDCSELSGKAREDLFMNSRDRLSEGALRKAIENELEDLLKRHAGLRALKERRQREAIASKLDDSKPLEEVLEGLLKHSPTLSELFLKGKRISTPFKTVGVQEQDKPFVGSKYPTYFKFKGEEYGVELNRNCHINLRCRITFETDAANDYFTRDVDRGEFSINRVSGDLSSPVEDFKVNLHNGIATLSLQLPANCQVGDKLHFRTFASDRTQYKPYQNSVVINVLEPHQTTGGSRTTRKPPIDKPGNNREISAGIALPNITEVYETEWGDQNPQFSQYTALHIKHFGSSDEDSENGNGQDIYDFFINMDNTYLKNELKQSKQDTELMRAKFKYGMVLLGLGLLHEHTASQKMQENELEDDEAAVNIEDQVEIMTRATAPILLPMIESLGELELDNE